MSGLCHFLCVIMPFCPQNYAKIMPILCPGLCQNYAIYAKIMPFMLKLCFYALCQNHSNCIMLKLCSFMLKLCSFMQKYANYAKIMPIMLYAPAMLLCQFLCWHNPLDPIPNHQPVMVIGTRLSQYFETFVFLPVPFTPVVPKAKSHALHCVFPFGSMNSGA